MPLGRLLHVRALNYLRREHALTYVGARILADKTHPDILDKWTLDYVLRRAKTRKEPVYWQHLLFKSQGENGTPDYRTCLVGSPTTLLQEVWVLWRISQEEAFRLGPAVFSYQWPGTKSHKIFRHFMRGYHDREKAIARAAESLRNPYVVVLDLRQFYPSIDVSVALRRFEDRVKQSNIVGDELATVLQCARGICRKRKEKGLPIGPPLAHVIASIYLTSLDNKMESAFPARYFRYVDDVALVVEQNETEQAKKLFKDAVVSENLKVNDDKTDQHPAEVWKHHVKAKEASKKEYGFNDLVVKLTQYLAHNPEDLEQLRTTFRGENFSIPFTSVKAVASYRPFRRLANKVLRFFGIDYLNRTVNPSDLLREANWLRETFAERAKELAKANLPNDGIQRRWAIQNLRYTFNRLLYLIPREDLRHFEKLLPNIEEVAPIRALYEAIITGDATGLLMYPGPAVTAFSQIWRETQTEQPYIDWSMIPLWNHRDAVMVLSLYGLCTPPADWISQFTTKKNDYSRTALKLVAGKSPHERTHNDMSYIDELESLFLAPGVDAFELLNSRFDNDEEIVLPALSLGEGSDNGTDYDSEAEY